MPWKECYVLRRIPERLVYADGFVEFEFAQEDVIVAGNKQWVFRARKVPAKPITCFIASSPNGRWRLEQDLANGVIVEDPRAVSIMERLVREGYAYKTREKFGR